MKYCNILDKREIKQKIEESLKRTKDTNREQGFNICSANGRAISTHIEGGEKDSVGIASICPKGSGMIGALHVHTRLSSDKGVIPSPTDIKKSIAENISFFCIGANIEDHGMVRCFDKEDLESEMLTFIRKNNDDKVVMSAKDIDRSVRLITGRMTVHGDYLDRHSCQKIFM